MHVRLPGGQCDVLALRRREEALNLWLGNVVAMRGDDPIVQAFLGVAAAQTATTDIPPEAAAGGSPTTGACIDDPTCAHSLCR